jgi:guanylate kinase
VLRERLVGRATDSEEEIEKRLRRAEVELEARNDFQHVVVNDDVDAAAGQLEELVREQLPAAGPAT